jgi:very-short-patch-repair endonuclease
MKNLINFARQQRKNKNPWEYKLWQYLRAHRFLGLQFKRQVPIDEFIVDFCCRSKKLIIELDGSQHQFSETDKIRDKKLEFLGYTILDFGIMI